MNSKLKTDSQFKRDLLRVSDNKIESLSKYKGVFENIKFKCKICKHEWSNTPNSLLKGSKCPLCMKNERKLRLSFTQKQYEKKVFSISKGNIDVLGIYKSTNVKIKHKCNICDNEWFTTPAIILGGSKCPKCQIKKITLSNKEFIKRLKEKHGNNIIALEEYKGMSTKIKFKCSICKHEFKVYPLLRTLGCKQCFYKRSKKTNKEYIKQLKLVHKNRIIPLEKYDGANTKINHQCTICKRIWKSMPDSILRGYGCKKCNKYFTKPYMLDNKIVYIQGYEPQALNWILENTKIKSNEIIVETDNIPIFQYYSNNKNKLYYPDIFIPSKNLIIEVKSLWTLLMSEEIFNTFKLKALSVKKEGYKFKLLIMNSENYKFKMPLNWFKLTYEELTYYFNFKKSILLSVDPGSKNFAYTLMTPKGNIIYTGMLKTTISDFSNPNIFTKNIKYIIKELQRLIGYGKIKLVFERYIPRFLTKKNTSEITNIQIGMLISSYNFISVKPITAATWKNFWNREELWATNDSVPEHILDSIFMGYHYLIKINKLTIPQVKKLSKKIGNINFNYYKYKGEWYYGKRIEEHGRGKRNSFGN